MLNLFICRLLELFSMRPPRACIGRPPLLATSPDGCIWIGHHRERHPPPHAIYSHITPTLRRSGTPPARHAVASAATRTPPPPQPCRLSAALCLRSAGSTRRGALPTSLLETSLLEHHPSPLDHLREQTGQLPASNKYCYRYDARGSAVKDGAARRG